MADEKAGVSPEETEIDNAGDDEAEDEFHPFDEVFEDYNPSQTTQVMAEDGLPTQSVEQADSNIPPLSPETLICMGDFSAFVKTDNVGRVVRTFSPEEVAQYPNGIYYYEKPATELEAEEAEQKSRPPGKSSSISYRIVGLLPVRPPCKHYVRQLGQAGDNPEMKQTYRLCSARRTTEGAFMSVRDMGLWACTMREPRDINSEKRHLDLFDERKMLEGKNREVSSIFKKG